MIRFSLRKVTRSCWAEAPTVIINGPVNHIGFGLSSVRLSDMKRFSERRELARYLCRTRTIYDHEAHEDEDSRLMIARYLCRERLDHFAVEEGLMIARLPCSHLYHGDCIVQWLESNHLCPLCRYQMPTVEVEMEPPEPSRPPLHWNVLMMSVGGVLTAAACFALQMIEAKLKVKISDRLLCVVPLVAIFSSKLL
ncbi:hypothetical protein M0R45_024254 [Rubus argutus]|uniref:RING-type E3 ubiquitin transferase n=1 Tax=Rubus argutus TaxID=59490 RepID=A0AAW1WSJ0_RUBAR